MNADPLADADVNTETTGKRRCGRQTQMRTANADADGKRRCERQRQMRTAKAWGCSGGVAAAGVFRDGFARFAAGHAQIVFRLQSQPGFRRDGEIDAEAERGIGGGGVGGWARARDSLWGGVEDEYQGGEIRT